MAAVGNWPMDLTGYGHFSVCAHVELLFKRMSCLFVDGFEQF